MVINFYQQYFTIIYLLAVFRIEINLVSSIIYHINHSCQGNMSELSGDDFTNGSSFFGFMGVSMALVLASRNCSIL